MSYSIVRSTQTRYLIVLLGVTILSLLPACKAHAQTRMENKLQSKSIPRADLKAISGFWADVTEYSNIAGHCYADGDVELLNSIKVVDDPGLRSIIADANRKANAPIPNSKPVYNMGTGTYVYGSRMNESAGFHCELYRTSSGKYVLGFAGTKMEIGDILNDYYGKDELYGQSVAAIEVATNVVSALKANGVSESDILFTGHSLGGRQAQEASMATGINAIVFNSADLSKDTKQRILSDSEYKEKADRRIIKVSSNNDLLTNFQHDHTGSFGQEVIQNRISIPSGGTHSIKDLNDAINGLADETAFAERVSHLTKEEQDICYSQYFEYKKELEVAEYEVYKWQLYQEMTHEMRDDAAEAARLHNLRAAINKESAEESLSTAQKKMEALLDAVQIAYARTLDNPSSMPIQTSEQIIGSLREFVFDPVVVQEHIVQTQGAMDYSLSEHAQDLTEGGHFLFGDINLRIIADSSISYGTYKLSVIENYRYILINNLDIIRVDNRFISQLSNLQPGEYVFSEDMTIRQRDDVIPSRSSNNRGLQ